MWSGAATRVDGDRINNLIAHLGSEPTEADVGSLMVAASRRAARPVYFERAMRWTQPLLQRLRQFQGALLGFNLGKVAEIRAHACHQPALEWRRRAREFIQQRLLQKGVEALPGHIWNDQILAGGEADAAV